MRRFTWYSCPQRIQTRSAAWRSSATNSSKKAWLTSRSSLPPEQSNSRVVCNGMPGRDRHSARLDAISSAVYVDAGIVAAGEPGRSKPFPNAGL